MLCCFKNICKLYHSLGLILNLACFTKDCVSDSILTNVGLFYRFYCSMVFCFMNLANFISHSTLMDIQFVSNFQLVETGMKSTQLYTYTHFQFCQMMPLCFTELYQFTSQGTVCRDVYPRSLCSIVFKTVLQEVWYFNVFISLITTEILTPLAMRVTCVCFLSYEMCVHILCLSSSIVFFCCC